MTKINEQNWPQLDFLINNFYEIVEYKRGRGIYGDRVVLKRQREAEHIFGEPDRLVEFFYMDANAVKELSITIKQRLQFITRIITSSEDMNVICEFKDANGIMPSEWAIETKEKLDSLNTIDFKKLNDTLLEQYKLLNADFITKLQKHREKQYFLASSEEFNFIPKEYAESELKRL